MFLFLLFFCYTLTVVICLYKQLRLVHLKHFCYLMAPIDLLFCSCRKKCLTPGRQKCPVIVRAETTPGNTVESRA